MYKNKKAQRGIFKRIKSEAGQSIAEFALILPVMLLLLMVPIDYARVLYTRMVLNSAATEALGELKDSDVGASLSTRVINIVSNSFGDELDMGRVSINSLSVGSSNKEPYTYYVYTSEKAKESFDKQFEVRPSNYSSRTVKLSLAMEIEPLTFLGKNFLGSSVKVKTREYVRDIYAEGYRP